MTYGDYLLAEGFSPSERVMLLMKRAAVLPSAEELLTWPGDIGEMFRARVLADIEAAVRKT